MRKLLILILSMLCACVAALAQEVRTVSAEFTYYDDGNHSRKECERLAIEGARLKALSENFGTTLSQSTVSESSVTDRGESTYYSSLSNTEVKGEWIEDLDEPKCTASFDSDGNLMIHCRVRGRARAISNAAPEFKALVLRNGSSPRHEDTHFRAGDDMKLYFKAPVDGYLLVYLADDKRNVQTLLPYTSSGEGNVKIKHGKEYVFFDRSLGDSLHGLADEMTLDTDDEVERCRMYVLFSPKPFTKADDNHSGELLPRSLPFNDFHRWLAKVRKNDSSLGQVTIDIVINK